MLKKEDDDVGKHEIEPVKKVEESDAITESLAKLKCMHDHNKATKLSISLNDREDIFDDHC